MARAHAGAGEGGEEQARSASGDGGVEEPMFKPSLEALRLHCASKVFESTVLGPAEFERLCLGGGAAAAAAAVEAAFAWLDARFVGNCREGMEFFVRGAKDGKKA